MLGLSKHVDFAVLSQNTDSYSCRMPYESSFLLCIATAEGKIQEHIP